MHRTRSRTSSGDGIFMRGDDDDDDDPLQTTRRGDSQRETSLFSEAATARRPRRSFTGLNRLRFSLLLERYGVVLLLDYQKVAFIHHFRRRSWKCGEASRQKKSKPQT
jgi:hypothetical protein